jgi:hypothetical protein
MEAERKRVANELRSTGAAEGEKIRADADRQREVIVAEAYRDAQKVQGDGDAKASAIYAESFGRDPQFAQFYRSLEAYRATFRSKSDVMVIDPSGEFFKAMRGPGRESGAGPAEEARSLCRCRVISELHVGHPAGRAGVDPGAGGRAALPQPGRVAAGVRASDPAV